MQALLFETGKPPEIVEAEDLADLLGGEIEILWPFEDMDLCLVLLFDREEMEPNRALYERTIRGPFCVARYQDDFEDISEGDAEAVEGFFSYAEEEPSADLPDPFLEDAQEEEAYGTIQIVDEETFYQNLMEEAE